MNKKKPKTTAITMMTIWTVSKLTTEMNRNQLIETTMNKRKPPKLHSKRFSKQASTWKPTTTKCSLKLQMSPQIHSGLTMQLSYQINPK